MQSDEEDLDDLDDHNFQSPPPYNVIEKIREANRLLEEDVTPADTKTTRVKFREKIVDFEVEISDISSDEAASNDEWMSTQLKHEMYLKVEEEKSSDKTLLETDSDDDDGTLMQLEDDVKLGFPHQGSYAYEERENNSSPIEPEDGTNITTTTTSSEDKPNINPPLVILVPRDDPDPSDHHHVMSPDEDEAFPSITETLVASSPISDDMPETVDGLSLSTDNITSLSKCNPESPITDLDISEDFQLSLDLNKEIIESNEVMIETKSEVIISVQNDVSIDTIDNNDSMDNNSKHAKRKGSLKLQQYRKSLEGPISGEWNQFQTVTDGLTPRDEITVDPETEQENPANNNPERPSSSRGTPALTLPTHIKERPWTAPNSGAGTNRGTCSRWNCSQLPQYNGMRSEYGLSQDQLEERKRIRQQLADERRERMRRKKADEAERREENERVYRAWLARKQAEMAMESSGRSEDDQLRLEAKLRREQAEESYQQWLKRKRNETRRKQRVHQQRQMNLQQQQDSALYTPDDSEIAFKQWVRNKRKQKQGSRRNNKRLVFSNDPATLQKVLNSMDPHTQSTFRIYLGVSKVEICHKKKNSPG